MDTSNGQAGNAAFKPFTKAERIQQLNDIDRSITKLLQSAGLAIQTLSATQATPGTTTSDRREAFQDASNSYLKTLQSVDVNLRRQILGLEEANIIPPDKVKPKSVAGKSAESQGSIASVDKAIVTEGTMGKLDIGWLNTRSGRVGRDMEAELWAKAKTFLEGLDENKSNGDGDEHMAD
ncbi:mediator complex protein [Phlyctema vagabunda]|uniref:Mediator of RNA polymerase II transcription subunit 11 n=1 Tax=Phlyctema vagabunda TaxID=108571 RepID=A0ABR4P8G9_9HELO